MFGAVPFQTGPVQKKFSSPVPPTPSPTPAPVHSPFPSLPFSAPKKPPSAAPRSKGLTHRRSSAGSEREIVRHVRPLSADSLRSALALPHVLPSPHPHLPALTLTLTGPPAGCRGRWRARWAPAARPTSATPPPSSSSAGRSASPGRGPLRDPACPVPYPLPQSHSPPRHASLGFQGRKMEAPGTSGTTLPIIGVEAPRKVAFTQANPFTVLLRE